MHGDAAPDRRALAIDVVAREAQCLDERDWQGWLSTYQADATLWVPAWRDEDALTEDPRRELSVLYLEGRALLEERVARLLSGRSVATNPVPRTTHLVTGSRVTFDDPDMARVKSAWCTQIHTHKDDALVTYAGRYEHDLRWTDDGYRIHRKKIVVINDRLSSMVDFFYF